MADKTKLKAGLEELDDDQWKAAASDFDDERRRRDGGAADQESLRKKVSQMSPHEFENWKREQY